MYSNVYSDSIEQVEIMGSEEVDRGFLTSMCLIPVTTGILSSVTATIRWNDGVQNRSKVIVLALSALTGLSEEIFSMWVGTGNATLESTLVGTGTYRVCWAFL